MAKLVWKGSTLLSPVPPVLVTCSDGEKDNVLTIAWTGVLASEPPKTYISVRPERHSYDIIKKSGVFAINLVSSDMIRAADSCGVFTGKKVDKFKRFKLEKEKAAVIDCPILAKSPLVLECRVTDVIPMGTHDVFIADVVSTDVEEKLVDEKGKLHLEKARLVADAHGDYFALGRKIGSIGYSVKKKTPKPPKKTK